MTNRKRTKNDLQNNKQKTNDRTTRTPLKTGGELMCFGRVLNICLTDTIPYTTCIRLFCSFLSNGNCPQVSVNTQMKTIYKYYDHRAQSPELPSAYTGCEIHSPLGSGETDYNGKIFTAGLKFIFCKKSLVIPKG